jgi:hypothetical protein
MRIKIVLSFLLFILGLIQLMDWILFSIHTENEKLSKLELHAEYVDHFPGWLQLYFQDIIISTFGCALLFAVASVLFITERKKLLLVLGIISFVLACWQLFSLT